MSYSVNALQTVADCNAMITRANNEKQALLSKQSVLEQSKIRYQLNSVEVESEIPTLMADLAFLNTVIPTMTDGTTAKEKKEEERRRKESRLYLLTNKKEGFGSFAVIETEVELAGITYLLSEFDSVITGLNARIATL